MKSRQEEESGCSAGREQIEQRNHHESALVYSRVGQGEQEISQAEDYNSHNTQRLDVAGMQQLLLKLEFIRELREGRYVSPEE